MATTHRPRANDRSARSRRFGGARRNAVAVGLVPALLLAVVGWRLAGETVPALTLRRTLAARVRLPGAAPALAWPGEGQAAVEAQGIGSFGSRGGATPVPIASVAKVMTAYLTLREHPLAAGRQGFTMTVTGAEAEEQKQRLALSQSTLPVRAGEQLGERQALQALLLPSANNVAAMLAARSPGGTAGFVARMNAAARALGMTATTYTDPSGFEATTVSTAADQLKLARAAMREPAFAAIVDERTAVLPYAGAVQNYDSLLGEDGYVGVKTGSDRAAGGCFVFAKDLAVAGRRVTVLGVVLGQRAGSLVPAALYSARRLGDSAAAAVRLQTALAAGTTVLTATAAGGRRAAIVAARPLRTLGWAGLTLPVALHSPPTRSTTLRAGQRIATVALAGSHSARVPAVSRSSLGPPSLGWRLAHLL